MGIRDKCTCSGINIAFMRVEPAMKTPERLMLQLSHDAAKCLVDDLCHAGYARDSYGSIMSLARLMVKRTEENLAEYEKRLSNNT